MTHVINLQKKIVTDTVAMEANRAGKTTLTNFWKSKASKTTKADQLVTEIENAKVEVND